MTTSFPLAGVRVLDLTRVLSGPFATRMLADLGADVVKVEPPEGDVTRIWGRQRNGIGGYFHQQNVGKRDISVDLQAAGAPELIRRLAATADIVVENFRPGVMDRYGIGWEDLRQGNPSLVMVSISGFGQVGPERDRASYAPVVHAETGVLARQAAVDRDRPTDLVFSLADTVTGLHGVIGALAALHLARATGVGQHVDLAMVDAVVVTDDYVHFALEDHPILEGGGKIFDATGGPIMLAGEQKYWWHRLSQTAGLVDDSPPDADLRTKIANRRRLIEEFLVSFDDRASLVAVLDKANLAWGDVADHRTVYDTQPTIVARGMITEVDDRAGGRRRVTQSPYRFSDAQAGVRGGAPHQGEHNHEVLREWLSLEDAEIDELHRTGVLQQKRRDT